MGYSFPINVIEEFKEKTLIKNEKSISLVIKGLKIFIIMCLYNKNNKHAVLMDSKYIDELWHALILDTREYDNFCKNSYGEIIHHNPAKKSITTKEMIDNNEKLWNQLINDNIIQYNDNIRIHNFDLYVNELEKN